MAGKDAWRYQAHGLRDASAGFSAVNFFERFFRGLSKKQFTSPAGGG